MSANEKGVGPQEPPDADLEQPEVGDFKNADDALNYLRREGDARPMTAEDVKRLVRKIDWMIVPLMWCCMDTVGHSAGWRCANRWW